MDDKKVIKTIKKVMPAVVSIAIAKRLEDVKQDIAKAMPQTAPGTAPLAMPEVPEGMVDGHGMVQVGGGSGFIIDAGGLILTNKHVVSDAQAEYTIILN